MKFFVNEEKRTVVAIIEDCSLDFIKRISKNPFNEMGYIASTYSNGNWIYMNDSYKGIAKCAPDDEFDVEIGKTIAMNRALRKYYSDLRNKFGRYVDMCDEIMGLGLDNYKMVDDRLAELSWDYEEMIFNS